MARTLRWRSSAPARPAIYAADTLAKSDTRCEVDLFDRLPAPFGLVRHGVAPDHPRIKQIAHALHRVLNQPGIRLFGNVAYGRDLGLADLRAHYDAVIMATGCERDRDLDIPGIGLRGSFGAAEFVQWIRRPPRRAHGLAAGRHAGRRDRCRERRARPARRARRLHLHFLRRPVALLGPDRVTSLRTERMALTGDGSVRGTGEMTDFPVQAVYRAIRYQGGHLAELAFDHEAGVLPHGAGRVLALAGQLVPGVYAVGWIKRGPVGLIGHTRGCALRTVGSLLADVDGLPRPTDPDPAAVEALLGGRGVRYTTWDGWLTLGKVERQLGEERGRERMKVVPREEMVELSGA
jgi:NADPH-dependent glutamate synthase beta subunit-like oxidoreductase